MFKKKQKSKKYDIGFLGDSFTEGTGLVYEDTFVGILEKKLPNKKIANLGVSSYSPAIYYTKIKKLLETGYQFNEIIVFLDISDLVDDALCYQVINNKIIRRKLMIIALIILILKIISFSIFLKKILNFPKFS